jgi:hypothetical protein
VHAHAIDHSANSLEIWIPATAPGVVRVADHIPERRSLAAKLASLSHDNSSPILAKTSKAHSLTEFFPVRTRFDGLELIAPPNGNPSRGIQGVRGQNQISPMSSHAQMISNAKMAGVRRVASSEAILPKAKMFPYPRKSLSTATLPAKER